MTQTSTTRSLWQGGGLSAGKTSKRDKGSLRRPALFTFFIFEVICMTVLQKIVIPINLGTLGGPVQVVLPLTYLALFTLMFFVKFKIDITRLIFMSAFFLLAFLSILMQSGSYSVNSVILMIVIYLPFMLFIEVSESTYSKILNIFLTAMIIFGGIVFIQHITQLIWSWKVWPNLDKLVPPDFLFDGFVYIQPVKYKSMFMKPNGVFFLEVSYLSQWTAVALAIELVYFRRLWRMIFYGVVLISCFAGTGLLLLLICGPVLLTRLSKKSLGIVAVVVVACLITVISINWFQEVQQRFVEVQQYNSSAHNRFITPFQILAKFAEHPSSIWVGEGPGSGDKSKNEFWWVVTKLAYEYGFLTTISFFAFIGYVLFKNAPSQRISFLLLILFNFMGGFIIPVYPILIFMLGGLFRIRAPKAA